MRFLIFCALIALSVQANEHGEHRRRKRTLGPIFEMIPDPLNIRGTIQGLELPRIPILSDLMDPILNPLLEILGLKKKPKPKPDPPPPPKPPVIIKPGTHKSRSQDKIASDDDDDCPAAEIFAQLDEDIRRRFGITDYSDLVDIYEIEDYDQFMKSRFGQHEREFEKQINQNGGKGKENKNAGRDISSGSIDSSMRGIPFRFQPGDDNRNGNFDRGSNRNNRGQGLNGNSRTGMGPKGGSGNEFERTGNGDRVRPRERANSQNRFSVGASQHGTDGRSNGRFEPDDNGDFDRNDRFGQRRDGGNPFGQRGDIERTRGSKGKHGGDRNDRIGGKRNGQNKGGGVDGEGMVNNGNRRGGKTAIFSGDENGDGDMVNGRLIGDKFRGGFGIGDGGDDNDRNRNVGIRSRFGGDNGDEENDGSFSGFRRGGKDRMNGEKARGRFLGNNGGRGSGKDRVSFRGGLDRDRLSGNDGDGQVETGSGKIRGGFGTGNRDDGNGRIGNRGSRRNFGKASFQGNNGGNNDANDEDDQYYINGPDGEYKGNPYNRSLFNEYMKLRRMVAECGNCRKKFPQGLKDQERRDIN